jgi:hypothetical protein
MANAQPNPPNHILIQVLVALDATGYPTYTYTYVSNSIQYDAKILGNVKTGDIVAWNVELLAFERPPSSPPYRLDFQDSSFFKTGSLEVADGGFSPYLPVRTAAKHGQTKYSVTVQGVSPNDDPQIQKDPVGGGPLTVTSQLVIGWDGEDGDPATVNDIPIGSYDVNPVEFISFQSPGAFRVAVDTPSNPVVPGSTSPFENSDGSSMMVIVGNVVTGSDVSSAPQPVADDVVGIQFPLHFVSGSDGISRSGRFFLNVVNPPPNPGKRATRKA